MSQLILFQGDSVTDALRCREDDHFAGSGYPTLVAGRLGYEFPGKYRFLNRGISGNRIVDLYARIKVDILNLKPDYLSILIGINDVWHEISAHNGVDAEKFERVYDMLISEVMCALPNLKLMLLEPFVLPGFATENTPEAPQRLTYFTTETHLRAEATKRLAQKYNAVFVPLQERFDSACKKSVPADWLMDGVHPTATGHELITRAWTDAFKQFE